jgi:WD40 repeat protein
MWVQKIKTGTIDRLAYAPDGRTLYTSYNLSLTAWDVATHTSREYRNVRQWGGIPRGIYPLADGKRIVWLEERYATVLSAKDGRDLGGVMQLTKHPSGLRSITSDGRLFYLNDAGVEVRVWNLTTRKQDPSRIIPVRPRTVRQFDLSRDGRLVAVVNKKREVLVYDWGNKRELRDPVILTEPADDVRFSPDGRTLALSDAKSRRVALWDVGSGNFRATNIRTTFTSELFAFNPALPVFVGLNAKKELTLFSTETGGALRALDFGLGQKVKCLCFSPDGLTCAAGGSNKQFAVFDVDL